MQNKKALFIGGGIGIVSSCLLSISIGVALYFLTLPSPPPKAPKTVPESYGTAPPLPRPIEDSGTYTFKSVKKGRCLDGNIQGHVYYSDCNGGDYQKWTYNNGRLNQKATGRCLTVDGDNNLLTQNCRSQLRELWQFRDKEHGVLEHQGAGKCIDYPGEPRGPYIHDCGSSFQHHILTKMT